MDGNETKEISDRNENINSEIDTISPLHSVSTTTSMPVIQKETSVLAQDMFQIRSGSNSSKKSRRIAKVIMVLLVTLGVIAGLMNALIIEGSGMITKIQGMIITYDGYYQYSFLYYLLSSMGFAAISCALCKYFSRAAAGSGLPEFKSVMASELKKHEYKKLVSLRILIVKTFGLMLSSGSGLCVGTEGPLVHTAACIAYVLMTTNAEFEEILDTPELAKQIFAAAAAIGVSSSFNAPVGGLLFSVEVTSTYYLISNYWKSFLAAASGSLACYIFLFFKSTDDSSNNNPLIVLPMTIPENRQFVKWEMIIFILMSVALGYLSHLYLKLHKKVAQFIKPLNTNHPVLTATVVACITAFFIYITGMFTDEGVGVLMLVSDIFDSGKLNSMHRFAPAVQPVGGLIVSFIIRTALTLLCSNLCLPAGIFMPVLLIGGLFGRIIGQIMLHMTAATHHVIYPASYALVGASAFASGITQTISVCVIVVELTGNLRMLLPCLVASVIGAGISKAKGLSIYDIGMINKGLESFQLLLMDFGGYHGIRDIIAKDKVLIYRDNLTLLRVIELLAESKDSQMNFPLITNPEQMKLLGCVQRVDMFNHIHQLFITHNAVSVLKVILEGDCIEAADRAKKDQLRQKAQLKRKKMITKMNKQLNETKSAISENSHNLLHKIRLPPVHSSPTGSPNKVKGKTRVSINEKSGASLPITITSDDDSDTHKTPSKTTKKTMNKYEQLHDINDIELGLELNVDEFEDSQVDNVHYDADTDNEIPTNNTNNTRNTPNMHSKEEARRKRKEKINALGENVGRHASGLLHFVENTATELVHLAQRSTDKHDDHKSADTAQNTLRDLLSNPLINDQLRDVLQLPVDLEQCPEIPVNTSPFSVTLTTPMEQVYVLFEMVRMTSIVVVENGRFEGMISRASVLESLRRKKDQ